MVSHVDHSEHVVDVIVSEQGVADIRGLDPVERAYSIINHVAHPDFKPLLAEYLREAISRNGAHEPHILSDAFSFHNRFAVKKIMLA